MGDKSIFNFTFLDSVRYRKKIKDIRVFECLPRQIRGRGGKCVGEVGDGFSLSVEELEFHLMGENISAPSMFNGFIQVKQPFIRIFNPCDEYTEMEPG